MATEIFVKEAVVVVLAFALINNRIIEMIVKPLWDKAVEKWKWDNSLLIYIALATGAILSVAADLNVFTEIVSPLVGKALTAIMLGGGANLINDITRKSDVSIHTYSFDVSDIEKE